MAHVVRGAGGVPRRRRARRRRTARRAGFGWSGQNSNSGTCSSSSPRRCPWLPASDCREQQQGGDDASSSSNQQAAGAWPSLWVTTLTPTSTTQAIATTCTQPCPPATRRNALEAFSGGKTTTLLCKVATLLRNKFANTIYIQPGSIHTRRQTSQVAAVEAGLDWPGRHGLAEPGTATLAPLNSIIKSVL